MVVYENDINFGLYRFSSERVFERVKIVKRLIPGITFGNSDIFSSLWTKKILILRPLWTILVLNIEKHRFSEV